MNFQEKFQKAVSQGQKSFKYKGEVYDIEDATEADLGTYQFGGDLSKNNLLDFSKNLNNNVNQFGNLGVNIKDVISDDPTQTFNNLIVAMAASQMYNKPTSNIDLSNPMYQSFQLGGTPITPTYIPNATTSPIGTQPVQPVGALPMMQNKTGFWNSLGKFVGLVPKNQDVQIMNQIREKENQKMLENQMQFAQQQNNAQGGLNSLFNGDTLNQLPTILSLFSSLANMKKGGEVKYEDTKNIALGNKIPIQAETQNGQPEYVHTSKGVVSPVKAKKPHSEMSNNQVTDLPEDGDYVFSSDKKMKEDWSKVPFYAKTGGEYKEGKKTEEPSIVYIDDVLGFKTSVPSKAAEVVGRRYKVEDIKKTERPTDPYTQQAYDSNRDVRDNILERIKFTSEAKKFDKEAKAFEKEMGQMAALGVVSPEEIMTMQAMTQQSMQDPELPMAQYGDQFGNKDISYWVNQLSQMQVPLIDPVPQLPSTPLSPLASMTNINPSQQSPAFGMPQGAPTFNYTPSSTGTSSGGSGVPTNKLAFAAKAIGAVGDIVGNSVNLYNTRKSMKEFMEMYKGQREEWKNRYKENKKAESTSATLKALGVLGTQGPEKREISDYLVSNLNPERNANIRDTALRSSLSSFLTSNRQNLYSNSLTRSAGAADLFDRYAGATQQTSNAYIQDIMGRDTALQGYYQSLLDEDFRVNQGNTDLANWKTNNLAGLASGNVRDLAAIDTNALQTDNQLQNAYLAAQKARRDAVATGIMDISSSIGKIGS